jgi:phosphohistidine phosphatase
MARRDDPLVSELLVLRHAKAGDGPGRDTRDHDRPLAPRGQEEAPRVGAWLAAHHLLPDRALASTATRAVQTARLVLDALGDDAPELMTEARLYLAHPSTVAETVLEHAAGCERLLLVGHNPGLAQFVEVLTGAPLEEDPETGVLFPTAALAHLELRGGWDGLAAGSGHLLQLVRGRRLPEPRA